jgi:RNase P subunit RPR2
MRTVVQRLLRNPAVDESGRTGKAAVPAAPETGSDRVRRTATKSFARCTTTTPPRAPLRLFCPSCDNVLVYERSHIGGVNAQQAEQWDYYTCASCGAFQYRHRTRKLTRMSA